MKNIAGFTLNRLFYLLIVVALILSNLPQKYLVAIYTPSILGYIFLLTLLLIVVLFIYLFIQDILSNKYKQILKRTLVIIIGLCIHHFLRNIF